MNINEVIHPAKQQHELARAIALIRKIAHNEYVDTRNRSARDTAALIIKLIDTDLADATIVRKSWSY